MRYELNLFILSHLSHFKIPLDPGALCALTASFSKVL